MGDIIHIDFSKKNTIDNQEDVNNVFGISPELADYLDSLREQGVDEDDILETIDAINDMSSYFTADDVIREFANGWLHQFL